MRASALNRSARNLGRCLIASLALHGLVLAAALEIPWKRVEASAARRTTGDTFTVSLRKSSFAPASLVEIAALPPNRVPELAPLELEAVDGEVTDVVEPDEARAELPTLDFDLELPFGLAPALAERAPEPERDPEPTPAPNADEALPALEEPAGSDGGSAAVPAPEAGPPQTGTGAPSEHAVFLEGPDPVYPRLSVRLGEEGVVVCRLTLEPSGRVERVTVITSSGHARLDRAAVDALSRWRFAEAGAAPRELVHRVVFRLSGAR